MLIEFPFANRAPYFIMDAMPAKLCICYQNKCPH